MKPTFELVEIAGIYKEPGYIIRALSINGRSKTLAFLSEIADTPDYEKIMISLKHVAFMRYKRAIRSFVWVNA